MKTKNTKFPVADSYLALIREFPLRPIRSDDEYDRAVEVMEPLAVRGEADLDAGETDYLDALSEFISSYDAKHHALNTAGISPLVTLKYLMTESETTPAALQKILSCSQSYVSLILSGKRELSKENIYALAKRFKVEPGVFLKSV